MIRVITIILLLNWYFVCFGQQEQSKPAYKKIKILLLGTFHFHESLDSSSRLHSNLFTEQRQKEVGEIVDDLVAFGPDKIFIERKTSAQAYTDSIYMEYKKGNEPKDAKINANEIVQLGFKTAKRRDLPAPICVDFRPEGYSDSSYQPKYELEKNIVGVWRQFDNREGSTRTNEKFLDKGYPVKRAKLDSLLQKSTLSDFLLHLNNPKSYIRDTYTNWNWFYSIGDKDDHTGMDWLANFWFGRNAKIYGNVLRQVDYDKDQKYLLIVGASHLSILKYLFEENPYFEVVEVNSILKGSKTR
jgi:hypothetical protein